MRVIAVTRSAADGTWAINDLRADLDLVVIGFDDLRSANAAIQDWVRSHVPEP